MPWSKSKYRRKFTGFTVLLLWTALTAFPFKAFSQLLATGDWYKMGVASPGVYKIDRAFLEKAGIDPAALSRGQIRIYSNGNGMLPPSNRSSRPVEPEPVATWTDPEQQAVYFYGEGPARIFYDLTAGEFRHEINPYTDTTYYFLTVSTEPGPQITDLTPELPAQPQVSTTYTEYWYYEKEEVNLLKSGRSWWGDFLGTRNTLRLEPEFPGIVPGAQGILRFAAIASAQVPTRFVWDINGQTVGEATAGTVTTQRYDLKAQITEGKFVFTQRNETKLVINLTYDKAGQNSASAYLDQIGLNLQRSLVSYEHPTHYRFPPAENENQIFEFQNLTSGFYLWDVSEPRTPRRVIPTGNVLRIPGKTQTSQVYLGFTTDMAVHPPSVRRLTNQHLRSLPSPDLLIITAPDWKEEALRLAAFREKHDGLKVLTVTLEEIYNEFSSGKPDVTAIRDLCRHFYRKGGIRYLLLFGDATYDFRNRNQWDSYSEYLSHIPTYQSHESLHPVYTYASDDYFGMLDDDAGDWLEDVSGDRPMQIGVGRLPVKNRQEARLVVDKLIDYATSSARNAWRQRITFVADNGDGNIHQTHADQLAAIADSGFLSRRLFVDEYPLHAGVNGNRAPGVNQELRRRIDEGSLIVNFTGHGDEQGWTDEQILTLNDILHVSGYRNMPLLFTATCEFGRYDNPSVVSGAELMLLSPRGGAIAAMTTTRPVFSSTNFSINQAFYKALNAGYRRLGDLMRVTKNQSLAGALNRNFVLLGDPSMKLAIPDQTISWTAAPDTLKPFEKTTVKGQITDPETGEVDIHFDGTARISVFDAPVTFETLGGIGVPDQYEEYRVKLFEGQAEVRAGNFEISFQVPDKADDRLRKGRIMVYAYTQDQSRDAAGQLFPVRGNSTTIPNPDSNPPLVNAYINSPEFRNGDSVDPNPVLYVDIEDDTGLIFDDPTGSCDAMAVLNDTLNFPITEYFTTIVGDARKGTVVMPLYLTAEGDHKLDLKFCDIFGNRREVTLQFSIRNDGKLRIREATVFPNPFQKEINCRISHNSIGDDLELEFKLYSQSGQLVFRTGQNIYNAGELLEAGFGPVTLPFYINPGPQLYVYELTLRSLQKMKSDRVTGKLIHYQ